MTERTIVIGLDGLIKPWADRLIAAGVMPHLARLIASGTYGRNAFVAVPTLTLGQLESTCCSATATRPAANGWLQGFLVMAVPDCRRGSPDGAHRMDRRRGATIAHTMGMPYPRDSEGPVLHQAFPACL